MKRLPKFLWFFAGALATTAFFACGSSDEPSGASGLRRVLARNVLIGVGSTSSAIRVANAAEGVDVQTKLAATNVVFEQNANADLSATNVQAALEELAVKLDVILPGTWDIKNENQEAEHEATGRITFDGNGGFKLESGSFAAIGMGSGGFCKHEEAGQTYKLYSPRVALFSHDNAGTKNATIPTLIEAKPNRLVFIGQGGCGNIGLTRVSILTRVST